MSGKNKVDKINNGLTPMIEDIKNIKVDIGA